MSVLQLAVYTYTIIESHAICKTGINIERTSNKSKQNVSISSSPFFSVGRYSIDVLIYFVTRNVNKKEKLQPNQLNIDCMHFT